MPLPLLAIPVVHSAGGWIASAGGSYLAGTLSGSWAGAFIAGNSALLSGIGIGASAVGAGAAAVVTGAGAAVTSAATSAGVALGIVTPTFLGLTPVGWAVTGTALSLGAVAYAAWRYKHRDVLSLLDSQLDDINAERVAGGLSEFKSAGELIRSLFRKDPK